MKQPMNKISFLLLLVFLSSCSFEEKSIESNNNIHNYIFLGHTYQNDSQVDERLADMDFSVYEQIWLGGDICAETTADINTIRHIDEIFDLSSLTTHWSFGNHDIRNGNIQWLTDATGRPSFYATYFNGITLLILNTNFSNGGTYAKAKVNAQYELIKSVCDTIVESSHLILITHHSVWNNVDQIADMNDYANGDLSNLLFSIGPNLNYADGVYPLLKKVVDKGINIIHIAGDFGQKVSNYQYLTSDSIQFIGSGITSNTDYHSKFPTNDSTDVFLVLHHNISERTITWTFEELQ